MIYLDRIYKKKETGINYQNDWQDFMSSLGIRRKRNAIRISVFTGPLNVAYYRVFTPFMELAKNPGFDIRVTGMVNQQEDIDWADILYFDRCADKTIISEATRAKGSGKKILYDTDDYMHGIPDSHPHKRNIENGRYLMYMDELCAICDVITVSTDYLKALYKPRYSAEIEVLPNCVRIEDYESIPNNKFTSWLTIGWGGSPTHYDDLKAVTPALIELFQKYHDLMLLTMNYNAVEGFQRDAFEGIPNERRIFVGGTAPHIMKTGMGLIDIGIAPLLYNNFTRAKSNVKFLEYSLCGAAMVATEIEPYLNDRGCLGLVKNNDTNTWLAEIEKLIINRELRTQTANAAAQRVKREYDIRSNVYRWEKLIKRLVHK